MTRSRRAKTHTRFPDHFRPETMILQKLVPTRRKLNHLVGRTLHELPARSKRDEAGVFESMNTARTERLLRAR